MRRCAGVASCSQPSALYTGELTGTRPRNRSITKNGRPNQLGSSPDRPWSPPFAQLRSRVCRLTFYRTSAEGGSPVMRNPAPLDLAGVLDPAWLTDALDLTDEVKQVEVVEVLRTVATKVRFRATT